MPEHVPSKLCVASLDAFDRFAAAVNGRSAVDVGANEGGFTDLFLYAQDYTIATMNGDVATRQQVLDGFPWHTSFDVMMLPEEMAREGLPRLS